MAHLISIYAEGVSGNNGDLVLLYRSAAEVVHIAVLREGAPDKESALGLCVGDLVREAVLDIAAHQIALSAVDVAELVEMRLSVNSSHEAVAYYLRPDVGVNIGYLLAYHDLLDNGSRS